MHGGGATWSWLERPSRGGQLAGWHMCWMCIRATWHRMIQSEEIYIQQQRVAAHQYIMCPSRRRDCHTGKQTLQWFTSALIAQQPPDWGHRHWHKHQLLIVYRFVIDWCLSSFWHSVFTCLAILATGQNTWLKQTHIRCYIKTSSYR